MPSSTRWPTRRRLLRSAAALVGAGAVAGCGGSASSSSSASNAPNDDPPDDAITDPPTAVLRAPRDVAVLRDGDGTDAPDDDGIREWSHNLLAGADAAASVSIADVDGAGAARQLLDATDFDAETVYVERHVVGECFDQRLCWIRWTDAEVETSYARVLRPAEVSCSVDVRVGITHLIRLPAALDPEQVNRFSSSSSGGVCRSGAERDNGGGADS
jgi:hypothetical protein